MRDLRLAGAIEHDIDYLGVDVVDKLLDYSRSTYPQFRFITVSDFAVPEADNWADLICAFSLFTHLLHEQTFLYIKDSYRAQKPGGKLVLSFLEYTNAGHRQLFLSAVGSAKTDRALIVFNDRDSLNFFGRECGYSNVEFFDGTASLADFGSGKTLPNGEVLTGLKALGQSLCVMTK